MDFKRILRKTFPTARSKVIERSLRALCIKEPSNVLVVGSGQDPYKRIFPLAQPYICMDISVTPNKTTIVADAHKIPFQNNCFDIVFASEVFEHLRDPQVFVNEAFRVIKKNGKLIITVPFMFHEHADPCDFWRPTKTSLRMLCSRYSEVKVSNQGNRLHSIFDLITTAFSPWPIFFPFRILNHLLVLPFGNSATIFDNSTAPSGFILIAVK